MKHFQWLRRKKSAEAQPDQNKAERRIVALNREDWQHADWSIASQATQIIPQKSSWDNVHNLQGADNLRQSRIWSVPTTGPHQPLSSSKSGIRLLTIIYADANDVICELTNYNDLDLCPAFIALSYTWGSPQSPKQRITLNGHDFQVRENLYAFLKHYARAKEIWASQARCEASKHDLLHDPSNWEHFWIDALCIDQLSIEEKSHQVDLMSQIFGRASFVLVWLGAPRAHASSSTSQGTISKISINGGLTPEYQLLVASVLNNPYWSRLWVVQEFVLAQDLLFCVDTTMMKLRDIRQLYFDQTYYKQGEEQRVTGQFERMIELLMDERYHKEHDSVPRDLADLVYRFSSHECEDKRDRIFGLLGLVGMGPKIEADYGLSIERLFVLMLESFASRYFHDAHVIYLQNGREDVTRAISQAQTRLHPRFSLTYGMSLAMALGIDDSTVQTVIHRFFGGDVDVSTTLLRHERQLQQRLPESGKPSERYPLGYSQVRSVA